MKAKLFARPYKNIIEVVLTAKDKAEEKELEELVKDGFAIFHGEAYRKRQYRVFLQKDPYKEANRPELN
jgi:hypothetical protein